MYKVFLVDDEIVVRESIRNINWDETQFIFSGEAPDGEMALSMVQDIKPDILITDIRMPFMDGLELSSILKRTMPWIKIIILSGHDEFDYAKRAISIGVEEYMLKPVVSSDLLAALNKVAESIEAEKKERSNLAELEQKLNSTNQVTKEHFLNDLMLGGIQTSFVLERAREMGIDLVARNYIVVVIEIGSNYGDYNNLLRVRSFASRSVELRNDVLHFFYGAEKIVLLIKGDNAEQLEETAYELSQSIKYDVERNTDMQLTIGIGSVAERIGLISKSFSDAEYARKSMGELRRGQIIGIKDFDSNKQPIMLDRIPIEDKLKYGSKDDIEKIIDEYIKTVDGSSLQSVLFTYYIVMDVLLACSRFITELGGDVNEVLPDMVNPEKLFYSINSVDKFRTIVTDILNKVYDYRDSRGEVRYGNIIMRAKKYIDANFAQPGICLHSVASEVNISPNHFSTIFSQETGITFIEYLTSVRINKAKELLIQTSMRASEISFAVGYNDPHYFSYFFKKHVGISPREFRNKNK